MDRHTRVIPDLIPITEAARQVAVSRAHMHRLVKSGRVASVYIGGAQQRRRLYVSAFSLKQWQQRRETARQHRFLCSLEGRSSD